MIILRLFLTALLIWRVALGETWALVTVLALIAVADEASAFAIRRINERLKR